MTDAYPAATALAPSLRSGRSSLVAAARFATTVIAIAIGAVLIALFQNGKYIPLRLAIVALFSAAAAGLFLCRFAPLSPLTRLMIALYTMPFGACAGYLFLDHYLWWDTPLSIYYMTDPVTMQIMVMTGVIGLWGLLTGYLIARHHRPVMRELRQTRTLKPAPFVIALMAAVFFSYINTPPATILSTVYTAARGLAGIINFNAAYLVSYTLLMLLLVDAEQERTRPGLRRMKRAAVLAVTAFIVVFFQVLRGDRDSFGYLVGIAAMFLTEPLPAAIAARVRRRRLIVLGGGGLILLTVFIALGEIRTRLAYRERVTLREAITSGLTRQSTATAVLLTNLSLAHSYRTGAMVQERGETYVQYALSLPPGFVTRALGIERPVEVDRGPNFWFTDISAGGLHIVTVPFKNFLAPGAFLILLAFGYLIARSERAGNNPRWIHRLWYGSMFVVAAQWFWYGDIVFVREVMSFLAAASVYALARRIGAFSYRVRESV